MTLKEPVLLLRSEDMVTLNKEKQFFVVETWNK